MTDMKTPTNRDEALKVFTALVARYGLRWTAAQPRAAYDLLAECNKYLSESDRREAVQGGRR